MNVLSMMTYPAYSFADNYSAMFSTPSITLRVYVLCPPPPAVKSMLLRNEPYEPSLIHMFIGNKTE